MNVEVSKNDRQALSEKNAWQVTEEKFECPHDVMEIRFRAAGSQYVHQCLTCGWTSNAIAHVNVAAEIKQNAQPVDDSISEGWYAARHDYHQSLVVVQDYQREQERKQRKREWLNEHNAYLRSHEWKARRGKVLRRDGYMCQACLNNPATQVHHLTYKHWGNEPLFELVAVCKPCHDDITALDRGEKPARPEVATVGNGHALDEVPY